MKKLWYVVTGLIAIIYLLNPTAGVFEFIPDNIPIIGNVDEALAMALLFYSLRNLGVDLNRFFGKLEKKRD